MSKIKEGTLRSGEQLALSAFMFVMSLLLCASYILTRYKRSGTIWDVLGNFAMIFLTVVIVAYKLVKSWLYPIPDWFPF